MFGGRDFERNLGDVLVVDCVKCEQPSMYQHWRVKRWNFIIVFPYPLPTRHVLLCPLCKGGVRIGKSLVPAVVEAGQWTFQWKSSAISPEDYVARTAESRRVIETALKPFRALSTPPEATTAVPGHAAPPPDPSQAVYPPPPDPTQAVQPPASEPGSVTSF